MKQRDIVRQTKADKGIRFANYIIDTIVNTIIIITMMIFLGIILGIIGRQDIANDLENINPLLDMLITWVLASTLYFITEYITGGRTIGKFITGTIVVNEDGSKPDMEIFLKRNFCRMIPFNALSFFGETGWHDSISRTTVVDKKTFENSLNLSREFDQIGQKSE